MLLFIINICIIFIFNIQYHNNIILYYITCIHTFTYTLYIYKFNFIYFFFMQDLGLGSEYLIQTPLPMQLCLILWYLQDLLWPPFTHYLCDT